MTWLLLCGGAAALFFLMPSTWRTEQLLQELVSANQRQGRALEEIAKELRLVRENSDQIREVCWAIDRYKLPSEREREEIDEALDKEEEEFA